MNKFLGQNTELILNLAIHTFTTGICSSNISINVINDPGYNKCDLVNARFGVPLRTLQITVGFKATL
jgi:hypothetical protein